MNGDWLPERNSHTLSVTVVSAILFGYLALWASLTIITLGSQLLGVPFKYYFRFSLAAIALLAFVGVVSFIRWLQRPQRVAIEKDGWIIVGLILAFVAVAAISLAYHTTGRLFLDDFYLTANPVYYSQHAQAPMGFESRTFYSGGSPVISVAFLTAGAYENILAIPAYLFNISYVTVYYRLAAVLNGLLLVLSVYFALAHFADDTRGALVGTATVLCLLIIMSENSWAIGNLAFIHNYEGKAILIMDGIPLLSAYSVELFARPNRKTWLQMFFFVTAMTGMSTSSFMILPILGLIVFLAWVISHWGMFSSVWTWFRPALLYLGAYSYLLLYALLVTLVDKAQNAVLFNIDYPNNFYGYLQVFLASGTWPATVALSLAIWVAAIFMTKGRTRAFILAWFALSLLLALNPVSAQLLLVLFRGIYFRLFYIIFHPLFAGVVAASVLSTISAHLTASKRYLALIGGACIVFFPILLSPTSIFLNSRYSFGNWVPTDDYVPAQKIVNNAPQGLMLAPYPLSGTVRMLSSNYPQLEARDDILSFYLGLQGRAADANARVRANNFLTGTASELLAFVTVLDEHPQVRSIVFSRSGFASVHTQALDLFLLSKGFVHHQGVEKYVVYWR